MNYYNDLEMTSDDLGLIFWTFVEVWPPITFWPWPNPTRIYPRIQGQGLSMVQVWSMWGQGLMSYYSYLEMTSVALGWPQVNFYTFLRFDLWWPFDFDLTPPADTKVKDYPRCKFCPCGVTGWWVIAVI